MGFQRFVLDNTVFDQSMPIQNLTQIPLTPTVKPGDVFRYVAHFDKREGCKVTKGGYNIAGKNTKGDVVSMLNFTTATYGTWPVGKKKIAISGVGIPKSIPPGTYRIWWRYCWRCKGARGELCIPPSNNILTAMPVTVQ